MKAELVKTPVPKLGEAVETDVVGAVIGLVVVVELPKSPAPKTDDEAELGVVADAFEVGPPKRPAPKPDVEATVDVVAVTLVAIVVGLLNSLELTPDEVGVVEAIEEETAALGTETAALGADVVDVVAELPNNPDPKLGDDVSDVVV